jgi:hypothetical protein
MDILAVAIDCRAFWTWLYRLFRAVCSQAIPAATKRHEDFDCANYKRVSFPSALGRYRILPGRVSTRSTKTPPVYVKANEIHQQAANKASDIGG